MQLIVPAILILLLGFGSGFYTSHKIDQIRYDALKLEVERTHNESQRQLIKALQAVQLAEHKAQELNLNLEKSHDAYINDINVLHDRLAVVRLRDPGSHPGCADTVPQGDDSGSLEAQTADGTALSTEFDAFLKSEANRADRVAAYAATCYRYLNEREGGGNADAVL